MKELIDAKIEGRELVAPEAEEQPKVINLMDALKQSVARGRPQRRENARRETARRDSAASRKKPHAKRSTRSRRAS